MARRPFFSGNYGSALGSTANAANIIARAGEAQGQMYANMGKQIGGMIQQYGLNKEKQKENKATIKSSIGILQRMSKIDEANAPQYMAQIQQLENEDVPLSQRGMLADKTLQGLSITNKLQEQMLSNQGKQQALGLARQLEASTVENAKLQNTYLGIRNDLAGLAQRKGQAVTDAEIRSILSKYDAEQETLPGETAAKIATNELTTETAQASKELLPLQTTDKKEELAAKSTQRKIADEVIKQSGGIEGVAGRNIRKDDLAIEAAETKISKDKSYMQYLDATAKGTMNRTSKNRTLEDQIAEKDKEIKSILSSPTFVKDGDGESVNIEDLFTIDRVTGEMQESEEANSYASADIARLKDLVRDRFNLRLNQTTTIIDGNGNKREVTIAQKEEMTRRQLEKQELERQRRINEAQRQETQAINASTLF